jgi:GMP synthase-like glutamine amidotransferase
MRILDIGANFGMPVGHVFAPWKAEVVRGGAFDKIKDEVAKADLVLLGGGADIHPSIYGQKDVASGVGKEKSTRDIYELEVLEHAVNYSKSVLGICRGAQLVCAYSGGNLVQHVDNHTGPSHIVELDQDWDLGQVDPELEENQILTNSVHHQMMAPNPRHAQLIGWTPNRTDRMLFDPAGSRRVDLYPDLRNPEIVYFGDYKFLAIQGHPEFYGDAFHPFVKLTRRLTNRCFFRGELPNV